MLFSYYQKHLRKQKIDKEIEMMNALKLQYKNFDLEKAMIMLTMVLMEASGVVFLFCGLFNIRLF